jgi:hypothetical protein
MEESMKKVLLLTLVAMMLSSMLAMSACKPKPAEEPMTEEVAPVEEPAMADSNMVPVEGEVPAETVTQ